MGSKVKRKNIVIITTGWFPEGDAGAVRLSMTGRILFELGFNVSVLCRGQVKDTGYSNGIFYKSLRTLPGGMIRKVVDYFLFPTKVIKYLKVNKSKLYAIYIYNAHISIFKYCKFFCKKNDIKLFHDCVEWYSPEEFKNGEKNLAYKEKNIINTKIIDKQFSVIAVSRYLEDYFISKGIRTIRIPILCDTLNRNEVKAKRYNDTLTIFYGGLPGTKDLLENLLQAALLLDTKERNKLKIVICGASRDYLIQVSHVPASVIDACEDMLDICGRVPREVVIKKIKNADFSFIARNSELRYAKAGFPSKIVESLSYATPVLCNISSDLGEYLIDGKNSIIASSHLPKDIKVAIQRAIKLTSEEKRQMSAAAFKTSKEKFDYTKYKGIISDFFN